MGHRIRLICLLVSSIWCNSAANSRNSHNAITCDQLPNVAYAWIEGRCTNRRVPYGGVCKYRCNAGYTLEGDSQRDSKLLRCYANGNNPNGKWSAKEPKCLDTTAPNIRCPYTGTKVIFTKNRRNYGELLMPDPVVTDNSKEEITNIYLTCNKRTQKKNNLRLFRLEQRHSLPYVVKYTAVDSSGNSNECQFNVEVKDNEPPLVRNCPKDIIRVTSHTKVNVQWDQPEFEDNSKKPVTVRYYRSPGVFGLGIHSLMYSAEDEWGNKAYCRFEVKILKKKCPVYSPPVNGALVCYGWSRSKFCTVQCQNNKEFARKPAELYVCDFLGRWRLVSPAEATMPWPDCSQAYSPGTTRLGLKHQYYGGSCENPATNHQIRTAFIEILKRSVFGRAGVCYAGACKPENAKAYCGNNLGR